MIPKYILSTRWLIQIYCEVLKNSWTGHLKRTVMSKAWILHFTHYKHICHTSHLWHMACQTRNFKPLELPTFIKIQIKKNYKKNIQNCLLRIILRNHSQILWRNKKLWFKRSNLFTKIGNLGFCKLNYLIVGSKLQSKKIDWLINK